MMDCKHTIVPRSEFGGIVDFICVDNCDTEWSDIEVIILTKPQHDLTQAVLGKARKVAMLSRTIAGCVIFDKIPTTPYEVTRHQYDSEKIMDDIEQLAQSLTTLDALKGE